jgi:hypothetical protein
MKNVLSFLSFLLIPCLVHGQANKAQNTVVREAVATKRGQNVYFELGGQSFIYSVTYDRRFFSAFGGLGASVGLGYIPNGGYGFGNFCFIPASINYLVGSDNYFFEIGAGVTILAGVSFIGSSLGTCLLGYRYQSPHGLLFRAGVSILIASNGFFIPFWPGVSLGYAF